MFERGSQLKGYIQRESRELGISSNYAYNYYFTRAFLEKLYREERMKLVLKGSYSQFVNLGKIARPLTDIDIVTSYKIEDAKDQIDEVIHEVGDIKFKIINSFTTTNATLNYKILCDFDGKTGRISLDLKREQCLDCFSKPMPRLFSADTFFETQAVSIEEHLSSKLYVVLLHFKLGDTLSKDFRRFKDFFDIYTILGSTVVDENKVIDLLKKKIKQDVFLRDYELQGSLFDARFVSENQNQWQIDKEKYQFLDDVSFGETVEVTNNFLSKKK